MTMSKACAGAVALVVATGVSACGSSSSSTTSKSAAATVASSGNSLPGKGKPSITIGSKNFTEDVVLGYLYADALKAKGFTVKVMPNIGAEEIVYPALKSRKIDMFPDYTGTLLADAAHQNRTPQTAQQSYNEAQQFAQKDANAVLLNPTPFTDVDTIAATKTYAQSHGLRSVADLKKLGASATLGARPEFQSRIEGYAGMQKVYGLTQLTFKSLDFGLRYQALDSGSVQVADVFSTDGQLATGKYVLLTDTKNIFGFQNAVPVVRKGVLTSEGPAFAATINAVSAKLTIPVMQKLNGAVDIDKLDPDTVAQKFLQANGLL